MRAPDIPTIETRPHRPAPASPRVDDDSSERSLPRTCVAIDPSAASLPSQPAIAIVDASGRYLRANSAWRRGVGSNPIATPTIEGRAARDVHDDDPVVGRMIHDVPPPLPFKDWTAAWRDALEGRATGWRQASTVDAAGHRHHVRWSMEPSGVDGGAIDDVMIVIEPISDCLRCLEDSKRIIARFSAFSQAIFDVVFTVSADWSTVRMIDGADLDADSTTDSRQWMERFVPIEDRRAVLDAVAHAITDRSVLDLEHRFIRPDGTVGWMHSRAVPILDPDGVPSEWIGASLDITDRKAAVASLRERRRHLAAVVETATDAILTVDATGHIVSANAATTEIFGHQLHAILGRHVSIVLPDLPRHGCRSGLLDMARESSPTSRVRGLHRLGQPFPLRIAVKHIEGCSACVVFLHDLTEEDSKSQRLEQATRLGAIGTLAAGIGHDMNTILLPIRARLDGVESDGVSETVRNELREIRRGLGFLQDLADGLHQLMVHPDSDDGSDGITVIPAWWRRSQGLLRRALPATTRFLVRLPDELPAIGIAPHELTQTLLNLLSNAGKAIPEGGTVALWARVDLDGDVIVGVSDDGAGMPEDVRHRAADPFFTTRRRGKGTGLGLALVHRVAAKSGGTLDIESTPGAGTTIALTLPAADVTMADPDDQCRGHIRLRVQDPRIASLLGHLLELENFAVIDEANGHHAPTSESDPDRREIVADIVDLDDWRRSSPRGTEPRPTIVVGHSKKRTDDVTVEGVAYVESNLSFDHLRAELRSALERILPC